MATYTEITSNYKYTGKGPVDAKQLVKTYTDMLSEATWLSDSGSNIAYNGMIVAVWLDKNEDKSLSDKNGIYFLFDPNCTTTIKKPDVTNEANWHRLDTTDLANSLSAIDERLTALEEQESDVITYGYRKDFPVKGELSKLYVAADEKKTYIWFNDDYLPVGGSDSDYEEPDIIYGGSAD
jgi:hypothetical protein